MNLKNNKKFIYFKRNMYTLSKLLKKSTIFGIKSFSKNVTIGLGIGTAIVFSNTDQESILLANLGLTTQIGNINFPAEYGLKVVNKMGEFFPYLKASLAKIAIKTIPNVSDIILNNDPNSSKILKDMGENLVNIKNQLASNQEVINNLNDRIIFLENENSIKTHKDGFDKFIKEQNLSNHDHNPDFDHSKNKKI